MSFFSPKNDEKITDKVFSRALLLSVGSILLCIVALCSITYAWFSADVSSGGNVLESGRFALEIQVTDADGNDVPVTDLGNGTFSCALEKEKSYTVELKMTSDTTATKGFCDVVLNGTDTRQSDPISADPSIGVDPLTFYITPEEDMTLSFVPKWGLPAQSQISNEEAVLTSRSPAVEAPE